MTRMKSSKSAQVPSVPGFTGENVVDRVIGLTPAPLLLGEALEDYFRTARHIVAVIQSKDAIEDFLTRDVIDLDWENRRLRRAKAGLLRASASKGVRRIVSTLDTNDPICAVLKLPEKFAHEWASGEASTRKAFAEMLEKADLTMDDVMAEALAEVIDAVERFDRMLASAEARRNNALREIERHREARGATTRLALDDVQDAEFQEVETGEVSGGTPP